MTRAWWRSVWGAWLAVYAPAALVLAVAFRDEPWLGALLLWWLKPLFDRFPLHVLSRSVFGESPRLRETLDAWRELLRPGLLASLTLYRLNPVRSFLLPVWQLERQTGHAARIRRRSLQRRLWAYAVWLTIVCANLEAAVLFSTGSLIDMFVPAKADSTFEISSLFSGDSWWEAWTWANTVAYAIAVSAVEPFYVAAGFSLYLDRRMRLEGWDVEVALRRLALRLGQVGAIAAFALAAGIALVSAPRTAEAAPGTPKQEIVEVLKSPEFRTHREVSTWVYRGDPASETSGKDAKFWNNLARMLAQMTQVLGWTALGVLALTAIWFARRLLPAHANPGTPVPSTPPPLRERRAQVMGLPEDLAHVAAALARQGRVRDALSLLYRGALAAIPEKHGIGVESGDTESDCLRRFSAVLDEDTSAYFNELVASWQRAAYSAQLPDSAQVAALCDAWPRSFRLRPKSIAP